MADDLQLRLTIDGIQPLVQRLGRAVALTVLRAPMERAVARLQNRLADYPSPPANSKYKRTGNLGRAWTNRQTSGVRQSGGNLEGRIGNAVRGPSGRPYASVVQGYGTQAGIHEGRWITDADALEQESPAIERDFRDAIADALR